MQGTCHRTNPMRRSLSHLDHLGISTTYCVWRLHACLPDNKKNILHTYNSGISRWTHAYVVNQIPFYVMISVCVFVWVVVQTPPQIEYAVVNCDSHSLHQQQTNTQTPRGIIIIISASTSVEAYPLCGVPHRSPTSCAMCYSFFVCVRVRDPFDTKHSSRDPDPADRIINCYNIYYVNIIRWSPAGNNLWPTELYAYAALLQPPRCFSRVEIIIIIQ